MPNKTDSKNQIRTLEAKGFYSDIQMDGTLSAVLVRSPAATGKIKNITVNNLPEGYSLFTADDIPGSKTMEINGTSIKIFGYGNISYSGEPLGILVGPDERTVRDLLDNVTVNFNVESLESALKNVINNKTYSEEKDISKYLSKINEMPSLDTVLDKTHIEETTSEILAKREIKTGLYKRYSSAEVEKRLTNSENITTSEKWTLDINSPSWKETAGSFCYMDKKNLHIYSPTRWSHLLLQTVSKTLKLPKKNIFLHKTKTSGVFSDGVWRIAQIAAQTSIASLLTKKPVKLILSQEEQNLFMAPGVKTDFYYKTSISKEGQIKAMDIRIEIDAGSNNPFAQEIADRLTISSCGYYKTPNLHIITKCNTSKNPPSSINIKSVDSQAFFAIENQMQQLCKDTKLFPLELRKINTENEYSSFPFHIGINNYEDTFLNTITISDFNRKYASFNMEALNRAQSETNPFFGLPLRGIGISSAFNISSYYGESSFNYDSKIEVILHSDNKLVIHSIKPSEVIQNIWKNTASEILGIKKENISIDSEYSVDDLPSSPEDSFSTISAMNELIKKCCTDIQKKRGHQPFPIISAKNIGSSVKKGWNKEKFTGNPFGPTSFATTVVEVELDSYTYAEKIKGIWITIDCGEVFDKPSALRTIRLEIQQELSMLVDGKTFSCDNIVINFIESDNKPGQIGQLIHNTLPAAFSSALSLALAAHLTKIPCTEKQIFTLVKEREVQINHLKELENSSENQQKEDKDSKENKSDKNEEKKN